MHAGGEIVILEDNQDRQDAMQARLKDRFPHHAASFFHEPAKMIAHLQLSWRSMRLISLDHDLDLIPRPDGSLHDSGTGMTVVDWLVAQPVVCPVIIHSTNVPAAKTMQRTLRSSGWIVRRLTPYDDLAWIDAAWLPMVSTCLNRSQEVSAPFPATLSEFGTP